MDLKPEKILEVEFSRSFRGFNEDEVNEFIEEIASAVEAIQKEKEKLQQENDEYKRKVKELTQYVNRLEGNLEEWKKQLEIEKE
ncbi:MAG: DivIVA domain-containing protein, partial [Candidatus Atribacteria bacterium]|nr:DivIVA domain-containing protein [Candidatus Atribacteria bacterium]